MRHVQRDRVFVQLHSLDEHVHDKLLSRYKPVILRAQHLKVDEDVVELELQELTAHRFEIELVEQSEAEPGQPARSRRPLALVEPDLLFNEVGGLQVLRVRLLCLRLLRGQPTAALNLHHSAALFELRALVVRYIDSGHRILLTRRVVAGRLGFDSMFELFEQVVRCVVLAEFHREVNVLQIDV